MESLTPQSLHQYEAIRLDFLARLLKIKSILAIPYPCFKDKDNQNRQLVYYLRINQGSRIF